MCPGRMRNGVSRSAARFGGRASAGCRGGTSATLVVALTLPSRRSRSEARAFTAGSRAPARSWRWPAGFPSDPS